MATAEPRAETDLLVFACFVVVGVIAVAIFPHHLAVVLLGIKFALDVRLHENAHVDNIVCTVGAFRVAGSSGAKLEVDQALLVHPVEVLAIISATIFATKVSTCSPNKARQEEDRIMRKCALRLRISGHWILAVVLIARSAFLELERVTGDPAEVLSVELTSLVDA